MLGKFLKDGTHGEMRFNMAEKVQAGSTMFGPKQAVIVTHPVEVSLMVPKQTTLELSYGGPSKDKSYEVAESRWCARYAIQGPKDEGFEYFYAEAAKRAMADPEVKEKVGHATNWFLRVVSKYGGTSWDINVKWNDMW